MSEIRLSTVLTRGSDRLPLVVAAVVAAVSLGGAAISVASALSPNLVEAMGPQGRLSVPLPMLLGQLTLAALAGVRRRAIAATAAGVLGAACTISVISGFFDGGYADVSISGGLRAYQVLLVTSLLALGAVAFFRVQQVVHRPALPRRTTGPDHGSA